MKTDLENAALVILNYNTPTLTISAVEHILGLKTGIHIVVVDNASTDNSTQQFDRAFKERPEVVVLKGKTNGGYAKGNNLGFSFIEKLRNVDYVGVMNPDVVADAEALRATVDVLKSDSKLGLVSVETIYNGKKQRFNPCAWRRAGFWRWIVDVTLIGAVLRRLASKLANDYFLNLKGYYAIDEMSDDVVRVDVVQGCFFFSRLSTVKKIGGFDERTFLYYEEEILAEKIRRIGLHNAILRNVWIQHNHREKDALLQKKTGKLFHMRCEYESRCLYLNEYSGYGKISSRLLALYWRIDYLLKNLICC